MYFNIQINKQNKVFTYSYNKDIELGTFCIVNFRNKEVIGVVIEKLEFKIFEYEIKEILKVLDEKLDKNLFKLITWMHDYYIEPYGNLLPLILKPQININKIKLKKISATSEIPTLNATQEKIANDIESSSKHIHLIYGVTGSGKTHVYISLIKKALDQDKSSIILVPEITLTPQLISKLESFFGSKVALWHSKLSEKKKSEYYKELESGEKKVVLGTRSALFCNVKNLGYIIIDEEHESTYKQEDAPRYHAKNVAIKRAMLENAKLILGSATPSFETYYQVKQGHIVEHKLENRYNNYSMPQYEVIDLNYEKELLTKTLIEKINKKIENEEQVIILLNRKAHSIIVKCNSCSRTFECEKCSTKLSLYRSNVLKCNQCETKYKYNSVCKYCGSNNIVKFGMGTEKLEDKLCEIFDREKILRMDSDTMNTNKKLISAYNEFLSGKYNILLGTQIVAKGFHFPNVTLVCVINAEGINIIPDYRSNEKTYQLITQVAGRAGRSEKKGEVLIQSLNPKSNLIFSIVNNDYYKIYEDQMNFRKILNYPPYSKHIKILLTAKNEEKLQKSSNDLYLVINKYMSNLATVYTPSNAGIYKISRRYRKIINIILNRENEKKVKKILKQIIEKINYGTIRVLVDVDSNSMF